MIHLVEGRSGSGKTRYVTNVLCELAKKGEKKQTRKIGAFRAAFRFLISRGYDKMMRGSKKSF